ncbi:MAG: type II secretion system protein N [Armatimonadota bacterium]
MAFIKTDPSQNKLVAVLIVILISTVGITAFRLKPANEPVSVPTEESVADNVEKKQNYPQQDIKEIKRNPFAKPIDIAGAAEDQAKGLSESNLQPNSENIQTKSNKIDTSNLELKPLDISNIVEDNLKTKNNKPSNDTNNETQKLPNVILHGIVGDSNGKVAILSVNGSEAKVYSVGERIEGGFRISSITESTVVLMNGKEKIVAKRSES